MVGRARRFVAVAALVAMTLLGTALAPAGASTGSASEARDQLRSAARRRR